MAASSNYKSGIRQARILTEETAFSGGMMWTGNNIDETHLKTIVNFNYDDTTGFLKTRDPFIATTDKTNIINQNIYTNRNVLIGAYNICGTDVEGNLSKAGWLYLFGDVSYSDGLYTCPETSLTWVYKTCTGAWHEVSFIDTTSTYQLNNTGTLVGTTGIRPILYDNVLYCTNRAEDQAFYVYKLCVEHPAEAEGEDVELYRIDKQLKSVSDDLINSITLLEATVTGFNALRGSDMFTYSSTTGTGTKVITGAYLKDTSGNVCIAPRLGQNVTLYPILNNIQLADNTDVVKLYKLTSGAVVDSTALWTELATIDVVVDGSVNPNLKFTQIFTDEEITYQIQWLTGETMNDSQIITYTSSKINTQLKLKEYNLPTAKGSCLWNGHLVLWDVDGASNSLFISEVDNFYYMPTPNNVALFETDIISCIPYMGSLLVFTADRVYSLTDNAGTFIQKVVQNNMPLAREDAAYLRAIKNMVFFKSGNYYYMIVPKAQSLTGELTVAPIYKNLAGWFDNKNKATETILSQLYPDRLFVPDSVKVSNPTDIYIEQDTVSILFDVDAAYQIKVDDIITNKDCRHTLFVNYNTNLRAWTMYLEDTTDNTLYPAALTASRIMSFVRVDLNGVITTATMQSSDNVSDGVRCMIDTGYRTLSGALRKRFREVQIKLYSVTENITQFGSAFYIDGCQRKSYTRLEEAALDNTGNIVSLIPVYEPNMLLLEASNPINAFGIAETVDTVTGSDGIELSDWRLDFSHFKRGAPTTIRIPVSGKGMAPRFIFISPKCVNVSINEINWVYRLMYGR